MSLLCRFRAPERCPRAARLGRYGKLHALVLAKIIAVDGIMTLDELARSTARRKNELKERYVSPLVSAKLLREVGEGAYAAPDDIVTRIEREHELTGVVQAEERQRRRDEEARREWKRARNTWRYGTPPPSEDEAAEAEVARLRRQAEEERRANDAATGKTDLSPDDPDPPAAEIVLSEDEMKDLEAILDYEKAYGAFGFSRSDCKALFYSRPTGGKTTGRWPEPPACERIAAYLGRTVSRRREDS